MTPSSRVPGLDGLRAIAASIVVAHHAVLVSPSIRRAVDGEVMEVTGTLDVLLDRTPLALVRASREAVIIFFVLSGYVLARPGVSRVIEWREYYVRRLLRLYLPVLAALAFAAVVLSVAGTDPGPRASWWVDERLAVLDAHGVWGDIVLVAGRTGSLISPLWTLRWEVLFSLLLPVCLIVGRAASRRWAAIGVAAMCTIIAAGPGQASQFLPIFGLGVIAAFTEQEWSPRLTALCERSVALECGTLALAATLIGLRYVTLVSWNSLSFLHALDADHVATVPAALGATLLVALATVPGRTARILSASPLRWLGARSFSLYLVHEPIILGLGIVWGWSIGALVVAVASSVIVAHLFYLAVERPSISIARRAGDLAARPAP